MRELHIRILCQDDVDTDCKRQILENLREITSDAGQLTDTFSAEQTFRPTLSLGALEIVLVIVGTASGLSVADFIADRLGVERPTNIISRLLKQKSITIEVEEQNEKRRVTIESKEGLLLKDNIKDKIMELLDEEDDE